MFYAKSTGGFYDRAIHGDNNPADAVEISDDYYKSLLEGQSTGKIIFSDLNGYPILINPPEATIDDLKAQKKTEIERARDAACVADVASLGHAWQADNTSQELLSKAIILAGNGLPLPPVWRDVDNVDMAVTSINDLLAIAGAIGMQTQTAYGTSWVLKARLNAATTIDELEAIVWP